MPVAPDGPLRQGLPARGHQGHLHPRDGSPPTGAVAPSGRGNHRRGNVQGKGLAKARPGNLTPWRSTEWD